MDHSALEQHVRKIRNDLQQARTTLDRLQELNEEDLPLQAHWEYYRLVDSIAIAKLVAHRLIHTLETLEEE